MCNEFACQPYIRKLSSCSNKILFTLVWSKLKHSFCTHDYRVVRTSPNKTWRLSRDIHVSNPEIGKRRRRIMEIDVARDVSLCFFRPPEWSNNMPHGSRALFRAGDDACGPCWHALTWQTNWTPRIRATSTYSESFREAWFQDWIALAENRFNLLFKSWNAAYNGKQTMSCRLPGLHCWHGEQQVHMKKEECCLQLRVILMRSLGDYHSWETLPSSGEAVWYFNIWLPSCSANFQNRRLLFCFEKVQLTK